MRIYMLNKPTGYLTARSDRTRPTVMELLPEALGDLHPVGRLDMDTEGLLLLTDDGTLDPLLLRPESHVEKVYFFRAFGRLEEAAFAQMAAGVLLEGTGVTSRPARAWLEGYSTIGACEALLPPKKHNHLMKNPNRPVTAGWIAIREGRKHQVKLMVKAVGGHVFTLKRVSIGSLVLDPALSPGQYRELTAEETEGLLQSKKEEVRSKNAQEGDPVPWRTLCAATGCFPVCHSERSEESVPRGGEARTAECRPYIAVEQV